MKANAKEFAAIISVLVASGAMSGCTDRAAPKAQRQVQRPIAPASAPAGTDVYQDLRTMALGFKSKPGDPRICGDLPIHGVVVDWAMGSDLGVATIVCLADGTTSMYTSGGGGVIGAGERPDVRRESIAVLERANAERGKLPIVGKADIPSPGFMRFTILTDEGLMSAEADTKTLAAGTHELSQLGNAVQKLITVLRKATPGPEGTTSGAKSYDWKKEHDRLWAALVPSNGQAETVQGELLRCAGKLTDEAYRNGNVNWDGDCEKMWRFVGQNLDDPATFTEDSRAKIRSAIDKIIREHDNPDTSGDGSCYYLVSERVVDWCMAHPKPIARDIDPTLRR